MYIFFQLGGIIMLFYGDYSQTGNIKFSNTVSTGRENIIFYFNNNDLVG